MKFCTDCKHHETRVSGDEKPGIVHWCGNLISTVTGQKQENPVFCYLARSGDYPCGVEGRLFEPKEGGAS